MTGMAAMIMARLLWSWQGCLGHGKAALVMARLPWSWQGCQGLCKTTLKIHDCRSTPARHAANPYRQERHPNAKKKLKHFIIPTKHSL